MTMKTTMKVSTSSQAALNGAFLAQQGIKLSASTKCRSIRAADDQDCKSVDEWLRTNAADPKSTPQVWLVCRPGPDNQALLGTVEAEGHEKAQAAARSRWPVWASDLHAFYAPAVAQLHEKYRRRIARDPFHWAVREAGRAIVARHYGIEVLSVDILVRMFSTNYQFAPYSDSFGRTTYGKPLLGIKGKEGYEKADEAGVSFLAGTAANARHRPGRNCRRLNESDRASIYHMLAARWPRHEEEYLAKLKWWAREQVNEHWTEIQTVAEALVERQELSGDDIDNLLRDHLAVKPG